MCVGAVLAVQEATLTLAALVRRFTLELRPGESVWPAQKNFTLRPLGGLHMAVRRREGQQSASLNQTLL
jgi:cytochrome P450